MQITRSKKSFTPNHGHKSPYHTRHRRSTKSNRAVSRPSRFIARSLSSTTPPPESEQPAEKLGSKMKIYTRTGDTGTSLLYNMQRIPKNTPYFDALGNNDELNSSIGLAREFFFQMLEKTGKITESQGGDVIDLDLQLTIIQSSLFDVGAAIATPLSQSTTKRIARTTFDPQNVELLESWIDAFDAKLPPLRLFILPSGGFTSSQLQIARTIARRTERSVVTLVQQDDCDPAVLRYLNRLSDYFFVAGRYIAKVEGKTEVTWRKQIRSADTGNLEALELTDARDLTDHNIDSLPQKH